MKAKILSFFILTFLFFSCSKKDEASLSFLAMDTFMTLKCYGKEAHKVNQKVKAAIEELDSKLSVTLSESDFYRLNKAKDFPVKVSDDCSELLINCKKISELTDAAFDVTLYPVVKEWGFTNGNYHLPSENKIEELLKKVDYKKIQIDKNEVTFEPGQMLDSGAVGKGFAGDKAIEIYKKNGIKSAMVDLGGNIQLLGKNPYGKDWKIGIKNPLQNEIALALKVSNCAVITSGGYERNFKADDGKTYIHIFDPKTGFPVDNDIASVTVISDSGFYADALSTALFVMGQKKAVDFWKKNCNFQMIIITKDKALFYTEGLKNKISACTDFSKVTVLSAL